MIAWDASALISALDASEPLHVRAKSLLRPDERYGGSVLLRVEVRGGMTRRAGTRSGGARQVENILRGLWNRFDLIPLECDAARIAEDLAGTHRLRGADAVHLAAAISFAARIGRSHVRFASGDREQLTAARREGIRVIALHE